MSEVHRIRTSQFEIAGDPYSAAVHVVHDKEDEAAASVRVRVTPPFTHEGNTGVEPVYDGTEDFGTISTVGATMLKFTLAMQGDHPQVTAEGIARMYAQDLVGHLNEIENNEEW